MLLFHKLVSFLLLVLRLVSAVPQRLSPSIIEELQSNLSEDSELILRSDPNYASGTLQRWTTYRQPTYVAAVRPATDEDVLTIVRIASRESIPFLATGGGHGLSITLDGIEDGISIDLGLYRAITVDTLANTVIVGGGNNISDVLGHVYDAGRELVTGSCACVGMVGSTLGGGVGRLQGLHGLITDSLLSADVVVANGTLLTASESQNPDLFWALRGSGASFGIVLRATYRIFEPTNGGMALNADFRFPPSANRTHWEITRELAQNLPNNLLLISSINYNEQAGGLNILFNAVFYGPEGEGRALLQPFLSNSPLDSNITYIPSSSVISESQFGIIAQLQCVRGRPVNTYTVGARDFDVDTLVEHFGNFSRLFEENEEARQSFALVETFPTDAVAAVPDERTSVPRARREIQTHMLWNYNYPLNSTLDPYINQFARDARDAFVRTSGFDELEVYITYSHGDEGPDVWYREKLERLRELKKEWDPMGLFSFMNPVPV